jgi:hypothetical protein
VACPLNCKCGVAWHPVPLLCNVPRAQKDALGYADSTRDKHCANHVTIYSPLFIMERSQLVTARIRASTFKHISDIILLL